MKSLSKLRAISVRIRNGIGYAVNEMAGIRVYEPLIGIPDCTVPHSLLMSALKNAPEDRTFSLSGNRLVITATRFKSSIPLSTDEPSEPGPDPNPAEVITADIGSDIQTARLGVTVNDNRGRPFLDYVYVKGGYAFGSNGRMACIVTTDDNMPAFELHNGILPEPGMVQYTISERSVGTMVNETSMIAQRPAEKFDMISAALNTIPTEFAADFTVNAGEFWNAVDTCSASSEYVSIECVGGVVRLSASGSSDTSCDLCGARSGEFTVKYQAKYLFRAAKAHGDRTMRVRIADTSAALFESGNVQFIVMGMGR